MVKVGSLLRKLRCKKVKDEDAAVDGKRTVQEMHNNDTEATSETSSFAEQDRIIPPSLMAFMYEFNEAFDQLQGEDDQQSFRPVDRVDANDSEENEPVSFLTLDPSFRYDSATEDDSDDRPFENVMSDRTKGSTSFISTLTMDPALQRVDECGQRATTTTNTTKDPPGLRRVRKPVDTTSPIAQDPPGGLIEDELFRFNEEESMLYYQEFPNSFVSIPETNAVTNFTYPSQDPSESSLSEVVGYQLIEI